MTTKRSQERGTVEAYIAAAPRDVRGKLRELRAVIRRTAPAASERISYGMPFYDYKGRLVYFAAAKAHIGLYIPPPSSSGIAESWQYSRRRNPRCTCRSARSFPLGSSGNWSRPE